VAAFVLVALLAAPATRASAAIAPFYPTQSGGDRGTDVAAIQLLFRAAQGGPSWANARGVVTGARNPIVLAVSGAFDPATTLAIKAFQSSRGLVPTGVVDPPTWDALVVPLGPGSTGAAVMALQRELHDKRKSTAGIDGVYGSATAADVTAFQAHMGLPRTGLANAATWRTLVWHHEEPVFRGRPLRLRPAGERELGHRRDDRYAPGRGADDGDRRLRPGRGRRRELRARRRPSEHDTHGVGLDADIRRCARPTTGARALELAPRCLRPDRDAGIDPGDPARRRPREEDPLQRPAS
jgi:peptidoglycan hydrolase-like protein with peptidoglycan-binding domain